MKQSIILAICTITLFANTAFATSTLAEEAALRGINSVCQSHLEELEVSYKLKGLNLTFFHDIDPDAYPSFHTSTEKFYNGASFFATTLSPDGEYCYISIIKTTIVNDQNCTAIVQARLKNDPSIQAISYGDGNYIHVYPESGIYQMLFIEIGKNTCAITETRMMWPGA
jgi:hypothetical protein